MDFPERSLKNSISISVCPFDKDVYSVLICKEHGNIKVNLFCSLSSLLDLIKYNL